MEKNYSELLQFINYYHSCVKRGLQNYDNTKIHFSYMKDSLYMEVTQNDQTITFDYFTCSAIVAASILNKICDEFISNHKMSIASIRKDIKNNQQLHIHNTHLEIICDLKTTVDFMRANKLVDQTFHKISSKENTTKKEIIEVRENQDFQNRAKDFFEHYELCLKRCENKEGMFDIYPYYVEGYYIVQIMDGDQVISYDSIKCTEKEAELLNLRLANTFINNHQIILSSINKNHNYSYKAPKLNGRLRIQNTKYVLNILFDESQEKKIFDLHEKALQKLESQQSKVFTKKYSSQ